MTTPQEWVELPVTQDDINYAHYYKQVVDENNGVGGQYFIEKDSWEGFLVEFAAEKIFPNAQSGRTVNGHDVYDYKWNSHIVDVKGGLAVNIQQYVKKVTVDIYVFGKLIGDKVLIYGWLTRDEVGRCRKKIKTAKYEPYYNIKVRQLHSIKELA